MKKLLILLAILFLYFQTKPFGSKKFSKSPDGTFWCRDRVNHPGRQCCKYVSEELITAPKILASKSGKINVIDRGFGSQCDLNCVCKVPEKKCINNQDCKTQGKGFICRDKKGNKKCQLPCAKDIECVKKFGAEYGCQNGFCSQLKITKVKGKGDS
ncbi:MAG: hypothetical protein P4L22_04620 [Candidatus Babeliales bacterium]|nr:hypothetical protein [Candidatus Babeliales bacterium]